MKQGIIAFKTKDGKAVSFKSAGVKNAKATVRVKELEKRLSAMEKAVKQYNTSVDKQKREKKAGSDGAGVGGSKVGGGRGVSGGAGKGKVEGSVGVVKGGGRNGGKLVGDARVQEV